MLYKLPWHTMPHTGVPWSSTLGFVKVYVSEAQSVKIRRDIHGGRSHPEADTITQQLDLALAGQSQELLATGWH